MTQSSAPAAPTPAANVGPGSNCPWTNSTKGFGCQKTPTNGSASTSTIPSSGTYKGYICPSIDNGNKNPGRTNVYYNGCYNSTNCTGNGNNLSCQHAWVKNAHSTWNGCVVDRGNSAAPNSNNYDTNVVTPTTSITATLYGVASALTLDEFSLWLDLRDDYWSKQGRKSVDAVAIFGGLLTITAIAGPALDELGLMPEIVKRVNDEINRVQLRPDVKERFFNQGVEIVGGSSEHAAAFIRADTATTARIIKEAGIRFEH